ncbi:DapH/DapD/GlmU-related protein [Mesorhizobium sp. VK4C]|uniref:DapH/DapD/GlmU-related protein n=1 Tax=Mesorhizobium captivum TaxID=3072319 RepID=UPI002A23AA4C|nr:DapH/DapD/GlmU-related protein [Mesorhizobium sp. VK4C]MDX8498957.1 DapH/DapD/GlmU-related protein [Mesorhizobium sp. VK4C]
MSDASYHLAFLGAGGHARVVSRILTRATMHAEAWHEEAGNPLLPRNYDAIHMVAAEGATKDVVKILLVAFGFNPDGTTNTGRECPTVHHHATDGACITYIAGLTGPANVVLVNGIGQRATIVGKGLNPRLRAADQYESMRLLKDDLTVLEPPIVDPGAMLLDPYEVLMGALQTRGTEGGIAHGTQVHIGVNLGAQVSLGARVIINTGANIDHDCQISSGAFIGPGAILCGGVMVGEGAFVGAGAIILPGVQIGSRALVPAGAVVDRDVKDDAIAESRDDRRLRAELRRQEK